MGKRKREHEFDSSKLLEKDKQGENKG